MRSASLPLFVSLFLGITTASCRLNEDRKAAQVTPEPVLVDTYAPPAEPSVATPAVGAETIPASTDPSDVGTEPDIDPADWTELPPELAEDPPEDDGDAEDADDLADLPSPAEPEVKGAPPALELASIAKEAWIYREPRFGARKLGYIRAGSIVPRGAEPVARGACKGGFYKIEPEGFVCVGKTATLDVFDPIVEASVIRPNLDGLPYHYATTRYPTPPLYARLPTAEEQLVHEPDLEKHRRGIERLKNSPDYVEPPAPDAMPPALLYGLSLPGLANEPPRDPDRLLLGRGRIRGGYAMLSQFDHEGRRFGVTTELTVVPLDRMRYVKPSTFEGLHLDDELTLPVAFVMKKQAVRYVPGETNRLTQGDKLGFREAFSLTGLTRGTSGNRFVETKEGFWLKEADIVRIDPITRRPAWATGKRKWIDVSILKQALIAYEGETPVYVTLVSTGVDGIGDPKETHSTVRGAFLIHTKHLTVTMDSDETGDEFDLRDVPFVQYFNEGYALHGAYWHDDFGTPRSHGCVNLAPRDAAWLFGWTTPQVPNGWHAALSLKKGTLVYTHP